MSGEKTHFGFTDVPVDAKAPRVAEVFHSVARNYDVMNDLMSLGLHRLWKAFTVARAGLRPGARILDIAAGSGDLAHSFARAAGPDGEVWLTDINESMLNVGRDRMLDSGLILPVALCDAELLPFRDDYFDVVSVAFGLRNMTHKERALSEMRRVVRPGGKVLVLEFSRIWEPLRPLYDLYSFAVLPRLGRWVANDGDSYRYLAESIRMHPDQATLTQMMRAAGFDRVEVFHLAARAVALHEAVKY